MLVLTRRPGEAIVLPELGVTLRVLSVKGRCVRVGVEAPRRVAVLREELVGLPDYKPPPALV
jgi:carbon storage regulator